MKKQTYLFQREGRGGVQLLVHFESAVVTDRDSLISALRAAVDACVKAGGLQGPLTDAGSDLNIGDLSTYGASAEDDFQQALRAQGIHHFAFGSLDGVVGFDCPLISADVADEMSA